MKPDKLSILSFIEWMFENAYITSMVFGILRHGVDRYMETQE